LYPTNRDADLDPNPANLDQVHTRNFCWLHWCCTWNQLTPSVY